MLPISDVHFAFCGIATVAATLGYACARRAVLALASPNEPSKADVESGQPEERSLKRKLDDADEHDVDAEVQSRPMKRNKTPPTDQHESDELYQEWEVIVAPPPPYEQAVGLPQPEELQQDNGIPPQGVNSLVERPVTPVEESVPPARPETLADKVVKTRRSSTPQPPPADPLPSEPETARPVTPPRPVTPTKVQPLNAFSAFSGSSSPFASYSKPSGTSPFALSGQNIKSTPAWRHINENVSDVFGYASPAKDPAQSPNGTASPASPQGKNALEVPKETKHTAKSPAYLTGEEDETVEAELKGVKLFVKRGRKEFTDGMYGHVKILAQKPTTQKSDDSDPQGAGTETNSRTRLLFRRDPLGQVSMNVGLHPTVRCHFDPAENILRVILMEQGTTDGKDSNEDVVVYALKPGRSQKMDFQSFANALCNHEGLKPRAVSTLATASSGEVAAS